METTLPTARVKTFPVRDRACISVYAYGLAWLDLFPQHGPGRKHERPIVLDDWQRGSSTSTRTRSCAG